MGDMQGAEEEAEGAYSTYETEAEFRKQRSRLPVMTHRRTGKHQITVSEKTFETLRPPREASKRSVKEPGTENVQCSRRSVPTTPTGRPSASTSVQRHST